MDAYLLNKLRSPDDHSELHPMGDRLISTIDSLAYDIDQSVPILLSKSHSGKLNSSLHSKQNSTFEYRDHYEKDARIFDYFKEYNDAATMHEIRRLHEYITNLIPKGISEILDVGSGNCWLAKIHCPNGVKVTSMDVSSVNIINGLAQIKYDHHYGVVGDAFHPPLKNESYECIVSAEVIEHVPHPTNFIHNLINILKPGGTLIISTPNDEKIPLHLCVHCNRPTPSNAHLHSFTQDSIQSLITQSPYIEVHTQTCINKVLVHGRTHVLLKYLGFKVWKWIDRLTSRIIKKDSRLILVVRKKPV